MKSIKELREQPRTASTEELPALLRLYADALKGNVDANNWTVAEYLERSADEIERLLPENR